MCGSSHLKNILFLILIIFNLFTLAQADSTERKKQLLEMIEKTPEGPIRDRIRRTLDAILDQEQSGIGCEPLLNPVEKSNVTVLYPAVSKEANSNRSDKSIVRPVFSYTNHDSLLTALILFEPLPMLADKFSAHQAGIAEVVLHLSKPDYLTNPELEKLAQILFYSSQQVFFGMNTPMGEFPEQNPFLQLEHKLFGGVSVIRKEHKLILLAALLAGIGHKDLVRFEHHYVPMITWYVKNSEVYAQHPMLRQCNQVLALAAKKSPVLKSIIEQSKQHPWGFR